MGQKFCSISYISFFQKYWILTWNSHRKKLQWSQKHPTPWKFPGKFILRQTSFEWYEESSPVFMDCPPEVILYCYIDNKIYYIQTLGYLWVSTTFPQPPMRHTIWKLSELFMEKPDKTLRIRTNVIANFKMYHQRTLLYHSHCVCYN